MKLSRWSSLTYVSPLMKPHHIVDFFKGFLKQERFWDGWQLMMGLGVAEGGGSS